MPHTIHNPKISIIIAAWNCEQSICRTVTSVLAQDYSLFEVIVVNDGSTDKTLSVLSAFSDPRIQVHSQENAGAASARNHGWRKASGEFFHFLDSDDILLPGALSLQAEFMRDKTSKPSFTYGGFTIVDSHGHRLKKPIIPRQSGYILDLFIKTESLLLPSSCMLHRLILEETGGFDESMQYHEDRVFFLKVTKSYPAIAIPRLIAAYTQSVHGKARRSVSNFEKSIQNISTMLERSSDFLSPEEHALFSAVSYNSLCSRFMLYGYFSHAVKMKNSVDTKLLLKSVKGFLTFFSLRVHINLLRFCYNIRNILNLSALKKNTA